MSAAFALLSDAVLIRYGGKFKFREKLSGRLADVLIHLYLCSAVLKRFEDDGRPAQDLPLVRWAVKDSLFTIQNALYAVLQNFEPGLLGRLLQLLIFPLGRSYRPPSDRSGRKLARILMTENPSRDRLVEGVFLSDGEDATGKLNRAFHLVLDSADAEQAIQNALRTHLTPGNHETLVRRAVESGVITEEQATRVRLAQQAVTEVIAVDDFSRADIEEKSL